jgi:hypothetical protein
MFTSSSQYKLIIGLEIDESDSNKKSEHFVNNEFRSFPVWNSYNDVWTFNLKEFKVVVTISNDRSKVNEWKALQSRWTIKNSWIFPWFLNDFMIIGIVSWIISQTTVSND